MAAFSALKADNSLYWFSFLRDSNWFLYLLTWSNKVFNLVWISWCSFLNELVSLSNLTNLSSWALVWASIWVLVVVSVLISFSAAGILSSAGVIYSKEYVFVEAVQETSVFASVNCAVKSGATLEAEAVNWFKLIFSVIGAVVCSWVSTS